MVRVINIFLVFFADGFTTKYQTNVWFAGYGALGKGSYFSDSFPKTASYVACTGCGEKFCQCDNPGMKKVIIARVLLGKPFIDEQRQRRSAEVPPKGFHSNWGPCNTHDGYQDSLFRSNEFAVADMAQIYPEFCITYHDYNAILTKQRNAKQKTQKTADNNCIFPNHQDLWHNVQQSVAVLRSLETEQNMAAQEVILYHVNCLLQAA